MTHVKLLLVVTSSADRRRLLSAWRPFIVDHGALATPGEASDEEAAVSFGQMPIREGLGLSVFIVDGGWRREYICRVLAPQVLGYALVVGPESVDRTLAESLVALLAEAAVPGVVAAVRPEDAELLRAALAAGPAAPPVTSVNCSSRSSVSLLLSELLEYLAAVPAA